MRRTVVGVMGGSLADDLTLAQARELGRRIAEAGWVLLSGGRASGVMQASVSGAKGAGGLTVGVLFDTDRNAAAEGLDIVIPTGMGSARNVINILASDVVVACRGSGGTFSEIALALRSGRPVVLLDWDPGREFMDACAPEARWTMADDPAAAVAAVRAYLEESGRV